MSDIAPILNIWLGLLAGLAAPYLATIIKRRDELRSRQRDIAVAILTLFESERSLDELMAEDVDNCRRRLLLLSVRLDDHDTREACLRAVSTGTRGDTGKLLEDWTRMVEQVSRLAR